MATKPIICSYEEASGFKFEKSNLVLADENGSISFMDFSDLFQEIESFSKSTIKLKAGKNFLLSQVAIGNELGYVSFIAVKCIFPEVGESKKYIEWKYLDQSYYMGELLVLSGKMISATDSIYEGWLLANPSAYSDSGGIIFTNPHTDMDVKLELIIGK